MLLLDSTYPTTGSLGDAFWNLLYNNLLLKQENIDRLQAELEGITRAIFGDGILDGSYTPPLLSIGTGLQVNVAAHTAINGFANDQSAGIIIVPPGSPTTYYLWEFQDGTYTYTPTNVNPGSSSNLAILLGTATANATNITAVDNTLFRIVYRNPLSAGAQIIEYPSASWDGGAGTRTGGSVHAFTTAHTIDATKPYMVFRSGVLMDEGGGRDYTRSGNVFTFVSGSYPISGEVVKIYYYGA